MKCSLNISSWNTLRVVHSRKLSAKNTTWKFMQIMYNVNWRLIRLTVLLAKQLYRDSFWLSRKRLFALQRRYDSWKGFKITTQQRCAVALLFNVFNTHTTTCKWRRICCCAMYEARVTLLEHLVAWELKVQWDRNIFFEIFLSDLDEKITLVGYKRHTKGNSETSLSCPIIYLPCDISHKTKIQLNSG